MNTPPPSKSRRPRRAHIVSHTHWDREWYLTFHQFRSRLTRVVGRVLDRLENEDAFEHFVLDGQSIVVEDYLKVVPEDTERVRRLVQAGALSLGPWYILPDEFLVSEESHVRNLLIGHQVAQQFGAVQATGYMPDSFGHVSQIPQLLAQSGIESFIYTRGNGDEIDELGWEYFWEAPDGSRVLAINQCNGYCNAAGLGFTEIWHSHTRRTVDLDRATLHIDELFQKMARRPGSDIALLNNGCDHFPPQQDFTQILATLRERFPDTEFVHSTFFDFVKEIQASGREFPVFRGELRHGKLHPILSGVWSARIGLKQANDRCQVLLSEQLEPIASYAHFMQGIPYPKGTIDYAWKLLLENHPHDSICGCSTDEVHRDMRPRFDGVEQTAEQEIQFILEELAPMFARDEDDDRDTVITVANPLPFRRTEVIDRWVVLQPFDYDLEQLELIDETGRRLPCEVIETQYAERFWGIDYRAQLRFETLNECFNGYRQHFARRILKTEADRDSADLFVHVRFAAELPATSHQNLRLTEKRGSGGDLPTPHAVEREGATLSNAWIRATLAADGQIELEDRATGRTYLGLNELIDVEDIGDEYDYCHAPNSVTLSAQGQRGEIRCVDASALSATLETTFVWELPAAINSRRTHRSEQRVTCSVTVRIRVDATNPWVSVETRFDNRAKDHRLGSRFQIDSAQADVWSDGHFFIERRSPVQPSGNDWVQPPIPTYPQQDFSVIHDGSTGLAVFNRGLPEAAIHTTDTGHAIELTLMRSVEWLSRDDFPSRRNMNAGPTVHTPDAQCLGPQRFHYAIMPLGANWLLDGLRDQVDRYRTAPLTAQGVEDQMRSSAGELVVKTHPCCCITAIKRCEERDTLIIRLYNISGDSIEERLEFGPAVAEAWSCTPLESREAKLAVTGRHFLELKLGPHRIQTLEIQFLSQK